MIMKTNIGRKVWTFFAEGFLYRLITNKTYTIVGETREKNYLGEETFVTHYTIKDDDGNEQTIDYNMVVLCPNTDLNERDMIDQYLADNGIYADDVHTEDDEIVVSISWGDWKHDHIWCENLMSYLNYKQIDLVETEENGSDCYSADHYYKKSEI